MEHAKAWVKKGHNVTWITAGYTEGKKKEKIYGVDIIRMGGAYTVQFFAGLYLLRNSHMYDVIVDEFHGFPFFTPLLTRKPVVAFIHEVAGVIWDYTFPFPLNVIGKWIERFSFLFYKNTLFWTDAKSMFPDLISYGIPEKNIHAISCPIPGEIPELHISKEKQLTCLFVSRLVPMKGINTVLEAFRMIKNEIPDAVLWVIGKGEASYEQEIKNLIHAKSLNDSVTLLGHVSNQQKYEYMARANILLHASVKEGWGLVVLEAASQGTPAVVYNVPGLKDVVQNDNTGILLSENSSEELALQTISLYKDKKRYSLFQKNGKKWVSSLHWKDVTEKSLELLELSITHS
jgi:glycosyltransferase involved in cell wall biosynthesis